MKINNIYLVVGYSDLPEDCEESVEIIFDTREEAITYMEAYNARHARPETYSNLRARVEEWPVCAYGVYPAYGNRCTDIITEDD